MIIDTYLVKCDYKIHHVENVGPNSSFLRLHVKVLFCLQ
jgi:hypothetical protein